MHISSEVLQIYFIHKTYNVKGQRHLVDVILVTAIQKICNFKIINVSEI